MANMTMPSSSPGHIDDAYHYPPELLALLVDTLVRVNRSKRDVVTFFRGAGVTSSRLATWEHKLRSDPDSVRKADIARDILRGLNEHKGNDALGLRREVLKRVVEFEDFSTCWEKDRLEAQGLVAQVRALVNAKDTVSKINIEREKERTERLKQQEAQARQTAAKNAERESIRRDLFALFGENNRVKRGIALEGVLNRLFQSYDILVRESFHRVGDAGEGIVEQIDGVIALDNHVYLVEMKWHTKTLGKDDVTSHLVSVYNRGGDIRGIIISNSEFTEAAVAVVKQGLAHKVFVLCELSEIVFLLERGDDLRNLLRRKVEASILEKQPLTRAS